MIADAIEEGKMLSSLSYKAKGCIVDIERLHARSRWTDARKTPGRLQVRGNHNIENHTAG